MNILNEEEFEEWLSKQFRNKNIIIVNNDNNCNRRKMTPLEIIICILFCILWQVMLGFGLYDCIKNIYVLIIYIVISLAFLCGFSYDIFYGDIE